MTLFEGALDALIELFVATRGFDGPNIAASDNSGIGGVEVEGEIDLVHGSTIVGCCLFILTGTHLVEGAKVEVLPTRQLQSSPLIASPAYLHIDRRSCLLSTR